MMCCVDWTRTLEDELDAVHLFDLAVGWPSIYRVFPLPGCLQFDLSFTPAAAFGATGPKFRLLFGERRGGEHRGQSCRRTSCLATRCIMRCGHWLLPGARTRVRQAEYWISKRA